MYDVLATHNRRCRHDVLATNQEPNVRCSKEDNEFEHAIKGLLSFVKEFSIKVVRTTGSAEIIAKAKAPPLNNQMILLSNPICPPIIEESGTAGRWSTALDFCAIRALLP